ncbi:MAG: nucleotidyltransferase family protein [Bacteroidota bacterium]
MTPFKSTSAAVVFSLCKPSGSNLSEKDIKQADPEKTMDFAARNGVAPWCYHQLSTLKTNSEAVQKLIKKFRMHYLQTLLLNQQKWKVFNDMNNLAQQNGIAIIPLKGTALAFTLYSQESLRPMGDIDILVPATEIFRFREILMEKGARQLHVPISKLHEQVHAHIPALSWQNTMIEPHQRLFALGSKFNLPDTDLFNHTTDSTEYSTLTIFNDLMQTYHLCSHTYKEYKMGGMRLGWLLDIALILNRNNDDEKFREKVMGINPKARKEIASVLQWASLLNSDNKIEKTSIPFPKEEMFKKEHDPEGKHKIMILHQIAGMPKFRSKATMLFREFFPEKRYMDHQYGKHDGWALLKLYFKRIAGQT